MQAGHYNDFIFVTLLRGAILAALTEPEMMGCTKIKLGRRFSARLGLFPRTCPGGLNGWSSRI
jgi:hypothetical protein